MVIYFFFTWESVKTVTVVMEAALHKDSLQRLCKDSFLAAPRAKMLPRSSLEALLHREETAKGKKINLFHAIWASAAEANIK